MTTATTERFTNRVADYAKHRPGYPPEVLRLLQTECGLEPRHVVADVGSGPGLLTEVFLKNGNAVFGVEPNAAMRSAGEECLRGYERFTSIAAIAERTTLADGGVDFVVAAQAFLWFDTEAARAEFRRILRPRGFAALIWNERRKTGTDFLVAFERLLQTFTIDRVVLDLNADEIAIRRFFGGDEAAHAFAVRRFDNRQTLDFDGLAGRVLSSSYAPERTQARGFEMIDALRRLFDDYAERGNVTLEYDTSVYYGHIR